VFSLSPIKIMVIVAVALLLLGPDKLPEVAHKLGSSWRALKRLQEKVEAEVREAIPDLPSTSDIVRIARSPVNMLNQLADRADARDVQEILVTEAGAGAAPTSASGSGGPSAVATSPPSVPPPVKRTDDAPLPPDPSLN
jgi:sec-independent protein translocase protein TatB